MAVPILLGFEPHESLVVLALRGSRVRCAVRADIPADPYPDPDPDAVTTAIAEQLSRSGASSAVIPLVSARQHPDLHRAAAASLRRHGVGDTSVLWTETTRPGARWSCLCGAAECTYAGTLPDVTGELTANAVARGQVVHPDRAAALTLVRPADRAALRPRAELLTDGAAAARGRVDPPALIAAVALHRSGVPVEDQVIVDMVRLARTPPGFSELLSLATDPGERGRAGAEFLLMLTRETPAAGVSEIATLAGLAQYLLGNGLLAYAALERACRADPGAIIPTALLTMIDAGMSPLSYAPGSTTPTSPTTPPAPAGTPARTEADAVRWTVGTVRAAVSRARRGGSTVTLRPGPRLARRCLARPTRRG